MYIFSDKRTNAQTQLSSDRQTYMYIHNASDCTNLCFLLNLSITTFYIFISIKIGSKFLFEKFRKNMHNFYIYLLYIIFYNRYKNINYSYNSYS